MTKEGNNILAHFNRVLSSSQAIASCDGNNDHVSIVHGVHRCTSGRLSLQRSMNEFPSDEIFHVGDVEWTIQAKNIVGAVAWAPRGAVTDSTLLKYIKERIPTLKVLSDIDLVRVGNQFSDVVDPNQNPQPRSRK